MQEDPQLPTPYSCPNTKEDIKKDKGKKREKKRCCHNGSGGGSSEGLSSLTTVVNCHLIYNKMLD